MLLIATRSLTAGADTAASDDQDIEKLFLEGLDLLLARRRDVRLDLRPIPAQMAAKLTAASRS